MIVNNPRATKKVEIEGATFTVRILPYGKRVELEAMTLQNGDAKTREGYKNILIQNEEFAKWGIVGHDGLQFPDGAAVPFKSKKEMFGDREYEVVDESVMDVYCSSVGLLTKLASAVTDFNYVREAEAKN